MTWKTIPGFDNFEICEGGQVRNCKTLKPKQLTPNKHGQLCVSLYQGGKRSTRSVSKIVDEVFGQYQLPDKVKRLVDEAVSQGLLTVAEVEELYDITYEKPQN